ncbi:hypothetical protein Desca_2393 [Desulfotomaculum nigrificans CO-1-SRB]|uniref:Uncharacterized protein n=1 Tax=Desulfotomaculum nigrificans (strain DSM 14880 / VKM B-2319 / CO-1-SRB) TaxID=868595 RepID=F6B3R8_DESCC|nr:hypothetical protein [Desulfotomaculum nigrificans]AEF95227.1 hypothetical protein Desca_2393 [Desulfotomaculum nigrificans CO-1-SRB]
MLEKCNSINECENVLLASLGDIRYLGEVDFTFDDIKKLSELIKQIITAGEDYGIILLKSVPACLSFYLIGKGILSYSGGDYWSSIIDELGISDSSKQYVLGAVFLKFIKRYGLYNLRLKGAHTYVAPILLHGGLPQSCYKEFYEQIVKNFIAHNLLNEFDIKVTVNKARENEKLRIEILNSKEKLIKRKNYLSQILVLIQNIIDLYQKWEDLQVITRDYSEWSDLPEYNDYRNHYESQKSSITQRIKEIIKLRDEKYQIINSYTSQDKKLLDLSNDIFELSKDIETYIQTQQRIIFLENEIKKLEKEFDIQGKRLWQLGYHFEPAKILLDILGLELSKITGNSTFKEPNQLFALIKEQPNLTGIVSQFKLWVDRFKSLITTCREYQQYISDYEETINHINKWETAFKEVAVTLSIQFTSSPEKTIQDLKEQIKKAKTIKMESDIAGINLQALYLKLSDAENRWEKTVQDINLVKQRLRILGEGSLEKGLEKLNEREKALANLKIIDNNLVQINLPQVPEDLNEALICEQNLSREIEELRNYISLKKEQDKLIEITLNSEKWSIFPDYNLFMSAMEAELHELDNEYKNLKQKETEYQKQIELYTLTDEKLLQVEKIIETLWQDYRIYEERQQQQVILKEKNKKLKEEIVQQARQIWPEGWKEDYLEKICQLDIKEVSNYYHRFREAVCIKNKTEEKLAKLEINMARPTSLLWLGSAMTPIGLVLVIAVHNSIAYLTLLSGFLLVTVEYYRYKKEKGFELEQRQNKDNIQQELLQLKKDVEGIKVILQDVLHGLPLPKNFNNENIISHLTKLQLACLEYQHNQSEIFELKQQTDMWQKNLQEVNNHLPDPIIGSPEQIIKLLTQQVLGARARKDNAELAKELLTGVAESIRTTEIRREYIKNEIEKYKKLLIELGNGDLEEGINILQKKKCALKNLIELEDRLNRYFPPEKYSGLEEAEQLECKLSREIQSLRDYIDLIKQKEQLLQIVRNTEEWAELVNYNEFISTKESELFAIDKEMKILKENIKYNRQLVESFTFKEQKLLELDKVIEDLNQNIKVYQENQTKKKILMEESARRLEIINSFVCQYFPETWRSFYEKQPWQFIKEMGCFNDLEQLYENFQSLITIHERYWTYVNELNSFTEFISTWQAKYKKVITVLSYPLDEEPVKSINNILKQLDNSKFKKEQADDAKIELETKIIPSLTEREYQLEILEKEYYSVEQKIKILGDGDFQEGIKVLKLKKKALLEIKEIEKKLEQYKFLYPEAASLTEATRLRDEKYQELNEIKSKLTQIEYNLNNCDVSFEYVDEPVRRFVIYGGDWAIKWIYGFISMHRRFKGETIELNSILEGLPARVVEKFWEIIKEDFNRPDAEDRDEKKAKIAIEGERGIGSQKKGAKNVNLREFFNEPEVILDTNIGEIKLVVGGYQVYIHDSTKPPRISLSIVSETLPNWSTNVYLRGYLKDGYIEIPEEQVKIPNISSQYQVTLTVGEVIRTWSIITWAGKPYMLFNEKGRRIELEQLEERRAWILFPDDYEIYPNSAPIAESKIYLNGNTYQLSLVNFSLEPVITLVSSNGERYEMVSHYHQLQVKPFLSRTDVARGVWAEGKRLIYTGELPKLCLPSISNKQEILQCSLRIIKQFEGEKNERLIVGEEILTAAYINNKNYYEIPLGSCKIIGSNPLGEYTLVLNINDKAEYSFDLVVIPDLMLYFEKEIYFPYKTDKEEASFTMVIPEYLQNYKIHAREPAHVIATEDDKVMLVTPLNIDELQAEIFYTSEGRKCRTTISAKVPKIRWKIVGANEELRVWSEHNKEVWHEHCCGLENSQLHIEIPSGIKNFERAVVYLQGHSQLLVAKSHGQYLKFNLSGLTDTLRSGKEIYELWLAFLDYRDKPIYEGELFSIRCIWRVDELKYKVQDFGENRSITASWLDRGIVENRVAKLWKLWEPWSDPLVILIPNGVSQLEHQTKINELVQGPYLIKFDVEDEWSGGYLTNKFPNKFWNTYEIYIKGSEPYILVHECAWKDSQTLCVSGRLENSFGKKEILFNLYGVVQGEYKVWTAQTFTDENGSFYKEIECYQEIPIPLDRNKQDISRPHWLGIFVRGEQLIYHLQIITQPGMLGWPLSLNTTINELKELSQGQIYIDCVEERLDHPLLDHQLSKKVLSVFHQGNDKIIINLSIGGKINKAVLWRPGSTNEVKIELETNAVKCITCGKIEPDQSTWDRKHYPRCKSFRLNFREIKAFLYWYTDTSAQFKEIQKKYLIAGNHLQTLFNSVNDQVPAEIWDEPGKKFNLEKLIKVLWRKEIQLLSNGGK